MSKLSFLFLLPVAFPLAACESMPHSADASKVEAAAEEEGDESPREEVDKAERALAYARIEMSIAEADTGASKRKAEDGVASAQRKLEEARKALEHFRAKERDLEMSKLTLGLDQASWRVEAEKQELAELEAMYKKDDVATLTKELVLQRGKKGVEFAERDLAHEQREAEAKRGFELPKKERELEVEVLEAELALRDARAEAEKTGLAIDLALRKARDEVADAENALGKAQKKASKAKP
jgi:hypothetical protein